MKIPKIEELIIFENDNYIIVNKPPYLSTLDERDTSRASVLSLLSEYNPNIQLGHRLDKETSGAIAIAKNAEAYRHLAIQFEKRKVNKIYHAVVKGEFHFENREVKHPIAVSHRGNVRIDSEEGKPSTTIFNTLKVINQHTLIECKPITGRMHQIRIHLATLRAPISADILYGGEYTYLSDFKKKFKLKKDTEEFPLIRRVALHAQFLDFADLDGNTISAEVPYPKDIRAFLNQLEKNS